jgi:calcineurin-like phosphoesterase family protein
MNTYVTSDLHFYHKNIFKFCPESRPWPSMDEMVDALVDSCNKVLSNKHNELIIAGDLSFSGIQATKELSQRLLNKQNVILVLGNHDYKLEQFYRTQFGQVTHYVERSFNKRKACISHYPMFEWNQCHRGSVMLHGHTHGNIDNSQTNRHDIGWDVNQKILPLEEAMGLAYKGFVVGHHGDL